MTSIETPEAPPASEIHPAPSLALFNALRVSAFRLVWTGESISLLGDQFYLIALPWLTLQLTGSGLAVGTVAAVAGIPRAVLMLLGGAITDRFSARSVMLLSNSIRFMLTALLTVLVLTHSVQLWMLYVNALLFGAVDAFFFPASSAIIPELVEEPQIESANALTQITTQLSIFIGPALAGLIIASLSSTANTEALRTPANIQGIGVAFGVDALTFLIASIALWWAKTRSRSQAQASETQGIWASMMDGLRLVWKDPVLRNVVLLFALVNFAFIGPIAVGIPLLASKRFTEGALALGIILGASGGGAVVGALLGGSLRPPKRWGIVIVGLVLINGCWLGLLGLSPTLLVAVSIAGVMGVITGYINVLTNSWLQKSAPPEILGRVMSLIILGAVGLEPFSNALAGALGDQNISLMFGAAGILLVLLTLCFLSNPAIRALKS